ncbi:hypothetical protein ACJX0J_019306, partial [Zea mays]
NIEWNIQNLQIREIIAPQYLRRELIAWAQRARGHELVEFDLEYVHNYGTLDLDEIPHLKCLYQNNPQEYTPGKLYCAAIYFLIDTAVAVAAAAAGGMSHEEACAGSLIIQHVLLDMPGLAFFTTYALLVLFWAEIYYQARAMSTDGLRPTFYWINGVVYAIQMILKNSAHEEELTSQVKGWIRSWDNETINVLDVLFNFPDISMELVEGNEIKS